MKQETLKEAIKKHLRANAFAVDPENPGFVDRFLEHTKAAEWGAEWQRNHVWHKCTAQPKDGSLVLAMRGDVCLIAGPNHDGWEDTVKHFNLEAWAYLSDLMPTSFDDILEANKDVLQRLKDE